MGRQIASISGLRSGIAAATLTAGALASAGLGSAPAANATCASFFGVGNTAQCTSNPTSIAIAIGTNAEAHAEGFFGTAFAAGNAAFASTTAALTFATAMGDQAGAFAYGLFGIATALGPNASAETSGSASANDLGFNIAINLSPGTAPVGTSTAFAIGVGNVAINLFGSATAPSGHQVNAVGILNGAVTIGGTNNRIYSGTGPGSALNYGFSGFGSGNAVHAGPGPAAIAGSILQTGAVITKVGPGVNINGVSVGGAAATGQSETAESTGAARSPRPTATGHRKPHTATQRRANH